MGLRSVAALSLLVACGSPSEDKTTPETPEPAHLTGLDIALDAFSADIVTELDGACDGPVIFQVSHQTNEKDDGAIKFGAHPRGQRYAPDTLEVSGTKWTCMKKMQTSTDMQATVVENGVTRHESARFEYQHSSCSGMLRVAPDNWPAQYFSVDAQCGADPTGRQYVRDHVHGDRQLNISPSAFRDQSWRGDF